MTARNWIGVDWGTTNLRAFHVAQNGSILDERESDDGMSSLSPDHFEEALLKLIADWLIADEKNLVLACGMVGAKQGWREADYRQVPCKPVTSFGTTKVRTRDPRLDVHILPGLSQVAPADVMRGEETQIAGFLGLEPSFDGAVCLPGTHSKWADVKNGEVHNFSTFMTGEMFALLSQNSVLKHSLIDDSWDQETFIETATRSLHDPAMASAHLFSVRAGGLVNGPNAPHARAHLSGLLIGQELGLANKWWGGRQVAIIGSTTTAPLYLDVLAENGVNVIRVDTKSVTLHGLGIVAKTMSAA